MFSWLSFLFAVGLYIKEAWQTKKCPSLKIGPDASVWAFWVAMILGALFTEGLQFSEKTYIIGEGRWVLLLYSTVFLLSQVSWNQERMVKVFGSLLLLVALTALGQTFTGVNPFTDIKMIEVQSGGVSFFRAPGMYDNTMTYSYSIAQWFCFLFAILVTSPIKNQRLRAFVWVVSGVLGISLLLTFTRGVWVSLFGALVVMAFLAKKKLAYTIIAVTLVVVPTLIATVPAFHTKIVGAVDKSNLDRVKLWRANWLMFTENPVLGVGHRRNEKVVKEYYEKLDITDGIVGHAHNTYLQILSGMGLAGFIAYIGMSLSFLLVAWRLWLSSKHDVGWVRTIAIGAIGAQISLHLGGLTESNFIDGEVNHTFIFGVAMVLALAKTPLKQKTWGSDHIG